MTLTAGNAYRFRLTNGTLSGSHLHLRNATGSWLTGDEDGAGNPEIVFTAPTSATYYLDARASTYAGVGTYTIAADNRGSIDDFAGSLVTTGVVTPGAPATGTIDFSADTDWFRMTLAAGSSYRFRLTNGTLPGSHLHLRNAAGSWLAGDDDGSGNPEIVYAATTGGTYYLDARAATYPGAGTYSVAADLVSGTAQAASTLGEKSGGLTASQLEEIMAPPTIDLAAFVQDASAAALPLRPVSPFAGLLAAADLPDEDRHRLEAAARFE